MEEEIIEIEHTADIGYIVRAKSLERLIKICATLLAETLVYTESIEIREERKIEVEFPDEQFLILDVLRELLFFFETENFIWKDSDVEIKDKKVKLILKGEKFSQEKHKIKKDIKAVTYHEYYLKKDKNIFETRFILDI